MKQSANDALWARAQGVIPGGVNSPSRSLSEINFQLSDYARPLCPPYFVSGRGSKITDADGRTYIDYVCGFGSMILGHNHPAVTEAITEAAGRGYCFGGNTPVEVALAELVTSAYPSVEKIRLVSSGTEAVMCAVRLARAFTQRSEIVKFAGCNHGHSDSLLVAGGAGILSSGLPESTGVLPQTAAHTHVLPYNDIEALQYFFAHMGPKIACVIVEPVAAHMGLIIPADGFLQQLRILTEKNGALLIFDEVITGFRHSFGGVQGKTGLRPDLTVFGKIIGGGLPLAAFGGRSDIMKYLAPQGPVYQGGTLSGSPVAAAAGLAALTVLSGSPEIYTHIFSQAISLQAGFLSAAQKKGIPVQVPLSGSLLSCMFCKNPVKNESDAQKTDRKLFARIYSQLLKRGVYIAPSPYEVLYVSASLTAQDVANTCDAISEAFAVA